MASVCELSPTQFRRRLVASSFPDHGCLADALEGMQFVQADPIRAPARTQDLVLRQRVPGYVAGDLERDFPNLDVEEGYLFAYGFMPTSVWRNLRWRNRRKLTKREKTVLAAVTERHEVHPRELEESFGRKSVANPWGGQSRETKRILEELHHHGYLRVSRRERGLRVYQVPHEAGDRGMDPSMRYRRLLLATAHVFGPTTKRFLLSELRSQNHLLPARKDRLAVFESLLAAGDLSEVTVADATYVWDEQDWMSTEIHDRVRILSPFDPLVRDRERFEKLWDWAYRFEAYVPAAKRERGYYAMPVLWRDRVVGWATANVTDQRLHVNFGYVEKRPRPRTFRSSAEEEVESLTTFLGLSSGEWQLTLG